MYQNYAPLSRANTSGLKALHSFVLVILSPEAVLEDEGEEEEDAGSEGSATNAYQRRLEFVLDAQEARFSWDA